MAKNLNDLANNLADASIVHKAFDIHLPDPTRESLDGFINGLHDPETISVLNAMMHVSETLKSLGYEPK